MIRKLSLAVALVLAACGAPEAKPEFLDAAPDVDSLMGEVTGDPSEGISGTALYLDVEQSQQKLESVSEYLTGARNGVRVLNEMVRRALTPIVELIKQNPDMATDTEHVWGPVDRGNATYKFTMKKVAEGRFGWKLEGKPIGAEDSSYLVVMGGGIKRNTEARRGRGFVGIDADNFNAVDQDIPAHGKLLMGFAHGPNGGKALSYALKAFTPDPAQHQPVSALLRAIRGPLGGTIVRMATYSDVSDPRNGTQELVLSRVRWLPTVGGRADGIVVTPATTPIAGDVPAGHYLLVNACWNAQLQQGYKKVRDCLKTQAPAECTNIVREEGQLTNCNLTLLPEKVPSMDPNAPESEDLAGDGLEEPLVPADMPSGDGSGL